MSKFYKIKNDQLPVFVRKSSDLSKSIFMINEKSQIEQIKDEQIFLIKMIEVEMSVLKRYNYEKYVNNYFEQFKQMLFDKLEKEDYEIMIVENEGQTKEVFGEVVVGRRGLVMFAYPIQDEISVRLIKIGEK